MSQKLFSVGKYRDPNLRMQRGCGDSMEMQEDILE